ncbi:MAG: hypothetical protein LBR36_09215 [Bacteroidales bacterium]|jgi:hypothetical protein|nr:hypothetical protein [Bacteroidales bacterium]
MKKFLIFFAFIACSLLAANTSKVALPKDNDMVLVCCSEKAYAYHDHYCTGLNKCEAEVKKVSAKVAVNTYKRKPCKFCYKIQK